MAGDHFFAHKECQLTHHTSRLFHECINIATPKTVWRFCQYLFVLCFVTARKSRVSAFSGWRCACEGVIWLKMRAVTNAVYSLLNSGKFVAGTTRRLGSGSQGHTAGKQTSNPVKSSAQNNRVQNVDDEVATTKWGSPVFRTLNFELYTKPTGWNRVLAYTGSTVFLGIMGYWTFAD